MAPPNLHEASTRKRARRVLRAADPRLAALIKAQGDIWPSGRAPGFELLCSIIVDQQISVAAAATIRGRLKRALGGRWSASALAAMSDEELRTCGVSRQKAGYLRGFAETVLAGDLHLGSLWRYPDDEVTERVTAVKGLGNWSAEMFLIFGLGRPDVLSTGDLGLQEGVRRLRGLEERPKPVVMQALCENWRPYRSLASLYLWASLEAPA